MADDTDLLTVRFRMQAEQVACLMDMVSRMKSSQLEAQMAEDKLELMEAVLWKHHARLMQLKVRKAAS